MLPTEASSTAIAMLIASVGSVGTPTFASFYYMLKSQRSGIPCLKVKSLPVTFRNRLDGWTEELTHTCILAI